MAKSKKWYLVAYDVRDEKRLRKAHRHIKGYGVRLQYSLFRCRLTERELERLRFELFNILDKEDDLLIVGLCQNCAGRVTFNSDIDQWDPSPKMFAVV